MATLKRNPELDRKPYMQEDPTKRDVPTGPDGGDLTTYSEKPRPGRNMYVGATDKARELDKTRDFTLGGGRKMTAKPGEDLYYNKATKQYEMRNAVGGGRSAGRGGATAEELRDNEEAGITTERKIRRGDYGRPGAAPGDLMPPVKKAAGGKVKAYAKGGSVRGDGCATKGKTKGRMV